MERGNDFQKFAQSMSHIGDSFKRIDEARRKIETLFTPFQSALPALESLKANLSRVDEVQKFFQEAPKRLNDQAFSPVRGIVAAPSPPMITENMMDEARKGLKDLIKGAVVAALKERTRQQASKPSAKSSPALPSVKDNPVWTSQADGANRFSIPESTLSKYANLPKEHLNFIESRKEGRRRFFKVADLDCLARTRRSRPGRGKDDPILP